MTDHVDYAAMDPAAFRLMVREWIQANYPEDKRYIVRRMGMDEIGDWVRALGEKGWLAPSWPREWGGMGLPIRQQIIFMEEMARHGCARFPDQALNLVGPLLMAFGTPEQKARHLHRIARGEEIWCQGYSEPVAGSDLASLQCKAVRDGDSFVVTGEKTWTTLAFCADWIFTLVRTDNSGRKQEGISILLIDLTSPGVTVRPIESFTGEREFAQVVFDNVRVPIANLVGDVNRGWDMAKSVLGHERVMVGAPIIPMMALGQLEDLMEQIGAFDDAAALDRYAALRLDLHDLTTMFEEYVHRIEDGKPIGSDVSLLKIRATELYAAISEEILLLAGDRALIAQPIVLPGNVVFPLEIYAASRVPTIYGGANEVQRNMIAKSVLRLPS
ncbi:MULTISPECIES: acyl-CoA dehydrogenase family protein [unclassified Sphingobium]|uniref:acyl-CoA dehydrogenase family protein n=1 Tax=unclassified Sphingobium TaxID=2611147 RepID=UPI0035A6FA23